MVQWLQPRPNWPELNRTGATRWARSSQRPPPIARAACAPRTHINLEIGLSYLHNHSFTRPAGPAPHSLYLAHLSYERRPFGKRSALWPPISSSWDPSRPTHHWTPACRLSAACPAHGAYPWAGGRQVGCPPRPVLRPCLPRAALPIYDGSASAGQSIDGE